MRQEETEPNKISLSFSADSFCRERVKVLVLETHVVFDERDGAVKVFFRLLNTVSFLNIWIFGFYDDFVVVFYIVAVVKIAWTNISVCQ